MNRDTGKFQSAKSQEKVPFITIEGVDGAGKSSHIEGIVNLLQEAGFDVVHTREPGGTDIAENIRDIILNGNISLQTEVYLAFSARADHLDKVIRPSLSAGKVVVCDRFTDSTYAYQGFGSGYSIEAIEKHEKEVHPDLKPDLTLLFDLPVEESMRRLLGTNKTPDNFESRSPDYFQSVRDGYLSRVSADKERFSVIDSSQPLEDVKAQVLKEVGKFIENWKANKKLVNGPV